ncbi:purine-nucleoside phosphorylase [Lactonifactor longoviformis]|uniref:Purine nucleoside phosphorylase n=1 Tax=Lactonifactor longoviformis DSM 17459 TaxID=1122155 RepID=A0A1M4YSJ7_9CLOT|nr:purine-nucleoside phosphorylase [Lactonifactor longoviformis]POP32432.1 purine-nucleoside phosphorylase [Lactonifactor longoviformis]SHF08711.1 purine-nucleoside phosphorylase [Lactonifactor longoviformis DSM 17459]
MNPAYKKLMKCYDCFQKKINFKPRAALVLGSGLGDYAETIQIADTLDYKEIEGFPVSTIPGHRGRFVFGYVGEVPVVIMQGRVHYYEGYSIEDVVLPVRLMKLMGAEILFLTNAAGGVNTEFQAGDFMMITDHISNFVPSPLIGESIPELGERFSDMSQVYDRELQEIIERTAAEQKIPLQKGVYIQLTGPNFETPHEVKMCRILGADAVGMSTACEAMAANHMGMKICGISCITNLGCGMTDQPLSHLEVQEIADKAAPMFKKLITESILAMNKIV